MLLVVGAQMSDGRLAALIGMLKPKSRIALSLPNVWRAMQVCNTINNPILHVHIIHWCFVVSAACSQSVP